MFFIQSRTLFLPALHGQYKIFKNNIGNELNKVDKVIQLGNLVGCNDFAKDYETEVKGKANYHLMNYVSLYKETLIDSDMDVKSHWVQLIGLNEMLVLNYPDLWTNKETAFKLINSWFGQEPPMQVAYDYHGILVTHGGLTHGEWVSLGRPKTAKQASELLNEKYMKRIFKDTCYYLHNSPNYSVNPIFCDPMRELYPSWIGSTDELPFHQIHGSDSLNSPLSSSMSLEDSSVLKYAQKIHYRQWGSIVEVHGKKIIGIDLNLQGEIKRELLEISKLFIDTVNH